LRVVALEGENEKNKIKIVW